jgi:hypothetical protein
MGTGMGIVVPVLAVIIITGIPRSTRMSPRHQIRLQWHLPKRNTILWTLLSW